MKVALFAFNGDPTCFVHVLLNALDLHTKGHEVRVVFEGAATKLIKEIGENDSAPSFALYTKAKGNGLFNCACKACSAKTGVLESAQSQGIALCDEMMGHPSMERFMSEGYQVISI